MIFSGPHQPNEPPRRYFGGRFSINFYNWSSWDHSPESIRVWQDSYTTEKALNSDSDFSLVDPKKPLKAFSTFFVVQED